MDLHNVQIYIEAKTKDELILKQIENNLSKGVWFNYSPPMKDGNKWVVWFFDKVDVNYFKGLENGN